MGLVMRQFFCQQNLYQYLIRRKISPVGALSEIEETIRIIRFSNDIAKWLVI